MSNDSHFVPSFAGDWEHNSFLIDPADQQSTADSGDDIFCKKWAKGNLTLTDGPEFTAAGPLVFPQGLVLQVSVKFEPGEPGGPAKFTATGTAKEGPDIVKGLSYDLTGWVAHEPSGKASLVEGGIRLMRGSVEYPGSEPPTGGASPGGEPPPRGASVGTVGYFRLKRKS